MAYDPDAIFDGTPRSAAAPASGDPAPVAAGGATVDVGGAPAAAVADPDAIFDGTPAPASAAQSGHFQSVPTRYLQPGESGYVAGDNNPVTNLSPADYARLSAGQGPLPAADTKKTGYVANIAAGGNNAIATNFGGPVDLVTGGINLATRGINAVTGTTIPPIVDPVGGSASIKRAMGIVDANPDDVRPDSVGQEVARGAAGGLVSAVLPGGIARGLVRGGALAAPAAAKVLSVTGDVTAPNAALGAASGAGSEAAASAVPDQYKPTAGLLGGMAAVGIPAGLVAGARGAWNGLADYFAPAWGRQNTILDEAGNVVREAGTGVPGSDQLPVELTSGQRRLAGQDLMAATSDPDAARAALNDPAAPAIAGDSPTTFHLTRDPGLGQLEARTAVRGSEKDTAAFRTRADQQNDARVGEVRTVAAGANPTAVPTALQGQAADADAAAAARLVQLQRQTAGDVAATDAAGQARVSGVQASAEAARAQREAEGQARLGGLRETAEQARARIGGNLPAGSEGQVGASLRAPLKAFDDATRARERATFDSIDPDGTLAVDMRPVRNGAAAILRDRSSVAAPMVGNEAGIFETAGGLQDVHSFKDLVALRSRLTSAIRQERISPTGDEQAVRRMSMLLGHVHAAMEGSARNQNDATLLHNETKSWEAEAHDAGEQAIRNGSGSTGRYASGGSGAVPPVAGAEVSGGGQRERTETANSGGGRGVSPGAANEVTPLAGSNRKAETLHDFVISRGGVKDQNGEYAAQDLDRIHHRAGGRLVNNTSGLSEDYMREAAVEEGFLPANADINDFRDAMLSTTPVHRIVEAHEAGVRRAENIQAWQEKEARYNSRDAVSVAADESGARLKPDEIEHATDLHMRGVDAHEAVWQAAAETERTAFDRNAAANAFGSPGVPLAAQQADNGMTGATRLRANFDQAAADRYAAGRAITAGRKGGFEGAPGVKAMLQGGPTKDSFKMPDAAVPAAAIRTGPSGADHVRVYLAKGGDPAALADAAAFSLRRDAMRSDGTLDPAEVAKWADKRSSFLSQLPDARAKFGDAAAAQNAFDEATKAEAAGLKTGDAADARALKAATAEAAQNLKQATATAQRTVDEAAANQAQVVRERQRSAVGKFVPGADPVAVVGGILRDARMGRSHMADLAAAVKGDPDATAGLQRAVAEHILLKLKGNETGAASSEKYLKANPFQTFLSESGPALREVMTDAQMASLENVGASLERSKLSVGGTRVGGGSDTVQKAGGLWSRLKSDWSIAGAGAAVGGAAGGFVGKLIGQPAAGAAAGVAAGGALGKTIQAAREAGITNVEHLKAQALLNPALFKILTANLTPANEPAVLAALASQLRRISLVSTSVGVQNRRDGPPDNGMLH